PGDIPPYCPEGNSEQSEYFAQTGALWHSLNQKARKRIIQGLSGPQCGGIIWRARRTRKIKIHHCRCMRKSGTPVGCVILEHGERRRTETTHFYCDVAITRLLFNFYKIA